MGRTRSGTRIVAVILVAIVVFGMAAVGPVTAVGQAQQPTGDEILDRVEQRYESADTIAGQAVVTTTNASGTTTADVSFAFADPNSSRIVVERGDQTYRVGTNGSISWAVGPDGAAVWDDDGPDQIGESPVPGSGEALTWATPSEGDPENVSTTLVGETEVEGVAAYELELRPTDDGETVTTLWVAQDDDRVLRTAAPDGTNRTVVDVTDVFFNVSIHESTFQPPQDRLTAWSFDRYDSFDATQDATDLELPTFDDGTFVEASVTVQGGETFVVQQYSLDGEEVSVVSTTSDRFAGEQEDASTVEVGDHTATVSTQEGRSTVVWSDGGAITAVSVEASEDRAVAIARALST